MGQRNLSGSIALSKVKHVLMEVKGKPAEDGSERMVKGMFVPFEANKLDIIEKEIELEGGKKGVEIQVYMPVRVVVKDEEDKYGQHGFISKSLSTKEYKALGEGDAAKKLAESFTPILGNMKEWKSDGSANDSAGNESSGATFTPSDDVPF